MTRRERIARDLREILENEGRTQVVGRRRQPIEVTIIGNNNSVSIEGQESEEGDRPEADHGSQGCARPPFMPDSAGAHTMSRL